MDTIQGLLTITIVHTLAVATPGPDFVLVSQQTLAHGKRAGLMTAIGITLGVAIHILYSALGLAAFIAHTAELLWLIKILGGAYLIYLGYKGLTASPKGDTPMPDVKPSHASAVRNIRLGFLCNILNPKAPLYLLTVFTVVLSPTTPLYQIAIYGAWMLLIELGWFSMLAILLSQSSLKEFYNRFGNWIEKILGVTMIALGLKVLLTKID